MPTVYCILTGLHFKPLVMLFAELQIHQSLFPFAFSLTFPFSSFTIFLSISPAHSPFYFSCSLSFSLFFLLLLPLSFSFSSLFPPSSPCPSHGTAPQLEKSYLGDRLVEGEVASRGRDYREVRHFHTADGALEVHFVFCTRIYSAYMSRALDRYRCEPPDLIVVNSCVWDISR